MAQLIQILSIDFSRPWWYIILEQWKLAMRVSFCVILCLNIQTKPEDHMNKKIIVITGATKGLGKALAEGFVNLGWHVAGCGLSVDLANDLQAAFGPEHIFASIDITDHAAVEQWANKVITQLGSPDLLINNAGVINKLTPLCDISHAEFTKVITTNVIGTFNVIKAFVPEMIKAKKGTIINISSDGGRKGEELFGPYCASKFAIEGLTQSLAQELPAGLITVTLDPGSGINTNMLQACYPDIAHQYPSPSQWAKKAISFILTIKESDNGKALTV